jgi:hypothetical protein
MFIKYINFSMMAAGDIRAMIKQFSVCINHVKGKQYYQTQRERVQWFECASISYSARAIQSHFYYFSVSGFVVAYYSIFCDLETETEFFLFW